MCKISKWGTALGFNQEREMKAVIYQAWLAIRELGLVLKEHAGYETGQLHEALRDLMNAVLAYQQGRANDKQHWLMCFLVPELELCRVKKS